MSRLTSRVVLLGLVVLVVRGEMRPIMAQPIGPRGAPLVSPPGFVGPGPNWKGPTGPGAGWSYYGLPNGPTTTFTDYRVGVWNWGWAGYPQKHDSLWTKYLSCYGPPVPSYAPPPGVIGGSDARKCYMTPPHFGYGLHALGYRSSFPRLATPSVSVRPSPAPSAPGCCRVDVRLPRPDAELWVNQTKTAATGTERAFESPELGEGKEFRYELVAHWRENGEPRSGSRSVVVTGGTSVVVDFTKEQ